MSKAVFAVCSLGASLTQNAVLCGVSNYNARFGDDFFGQLVLAVVLPRLIVCCVQSASDAGANAYWGEERMNFARLFGGYLLTGGIMLGLPFCETRFGVLVLGYLVGVGNGVLFGALQQIAMSSEDLQATFAFGNQLSGLVVFVLARGAGFDHDAQLEQRMGFFFSVCFVQLACMVLVCGGCVSLSTTDSDRRDAGEEVGLVNAQATYFLQTHHGKLVGLSLFLTAGSSSGLLPFYSKYRSDVDVNFSQHLFFTRLFADALSRPATICSASLRHAPGLLFASAIRILLLGPLLVYFVAITSPDRSFLNPAQSWTVLLLLVLFAFSGGFVSTRCYQVALKGTAHRHRAQVAASLSVVYSLAAALPVLVTFVWTNNL